MQTIQNMLIYLHLWMVYIGFAFSASKIKN